MKRALPWILSCLALGLVIAGLFALGKRGPKIVPALSGPMATSLFTSTPQGSGDLLQLQPAADQPLRSVRFLPALKQGVVLTQVLTQTGDQMVGRFVAGTFEGTLRISLPEGVPGSFFRFARLQEASILQDGSLLLFYVDGTGSGDAAWLLDMDVESNSIRWTLKAAGSHLAMEPSGQSCLLWGNGMLSRASWTKKPEFRPLDLPEGVTLMDAVLPMPDGVTLLAHPGGLAQFRGGAWTLTPLPDPGPLAFPGAPGSLARVGTDAYWQPRPGQLTRIVPDGSLAPIDLSTLSLPPGHERDAAMLRLAGADAHGRLWFLMATPDFTISPHPAEADQPSAALRATAAMAGKSAPTPEPSPSDPTPWLDYLKGGLDRAYAWNPRDTAPRLVDWKTLWPSLGAPSDSSLPLPRNLQPAGGSLLIDMDTRAWWVPLDKILP